jgi:hypothetical protein
LATKERAVNPINVFWWGKNGAKSSYLERKKKVEIDRFRP